MLVVVVYGYSSSLWFLRGIWGNLPATTEFGYQNTADAVKFFSGQGKDIEIIIYTILGFYTKSVWRMTYIQDAKGEYVSFIPHPLSTHAVQEALQDSGWEVERVAWIVVAKRSNQEVPEHPRTHSIWAATLHEAVALAHNLPASPLFFFRSRADKGHPLAAYAAKQQGVVYGSASIDSFDFGTSKKRSYEYKEIPHSQELIVAVPSGIFLSIQKEFLGSLEGSIARALKFQKTTPNIVSSIPKEQDLYIAKDKNEIGLGAHLQKDTFEHSMIAFMNREQGERHPKKKAFALPDRSLGYEYIRGAANVRFTSLEDNKCADIHEYDEKLVICKNQKNIVVASSEDIGKTLLGFIDNTHESWRGYISGKYPLYFIGTDNQITFWITDVKE